MNLDKIKGAKVKPKKTVEVEALNALEITLTKNDLGGMIDNLENAWRFMEDIDKANLMLEGSAETGYFYEITAPWSNSGNTSPF